MPWSLLFEEAIKEAEVTIQRRKDREENDSSIVNLIMSAQNCDELIYVLVVYHICGKTEEEAFHKKLRQFRPTLTIEQVDQMLKCFEEHSNCHDLLGVIRLRLEE